MQDPSRSGSSHKQEQPQSKGSGANRSNPKDPIKPNVKKTHSREETTFPFKFTPGEDFYLLNSLADARSQILLQLYDFSKAGGMNRKPVPQYFETW